MLFAGASTVSLVETVVLRAIGGAGAVLHLLSGTMRFNASEVADAHAYGDGGVVAMGRADTETLVGGRRLSAYALHHERSALWRTRRLDVAPNPSMDAVGDHDGCGLLVMSRTTLRNTSAARGSVLYVNGGEAQFTGSTVMNPSPSAVGMLYVVDGVLGQ